MPNATAHLMAATAPTWKTGHTLLPLTHAGWPLDLDTWAELAERWGYAVEIRPGKTGEDLANPTSEASRAVALCKERGCPASLFSRRVMQSAADATALLPESAWCHDAAGKRVMKSQTMPACKWQLDEGTRQALANAEAAQVRAVVQAGVIPALMLNGAEYDIAVPEVGGRYWNLDPAFAPWKAAHHSPDGYGQAKAMQEQEIMWFVRGAPANNMEVIYYGTGDRCRGLQQEKSRIGWGWPYRWMRHAGTRPSFQFYWNRDGGWSLPVKNNGISMPLLATNCAAQGIELGDTLGYHWVCAGEYLGQTATDASYMGFLKFLYTLGSVGQVASYCRYPTRAVDGYDGFLGDCGTTPPDWVRQMMILSHVHATFSWLEPFLRYGDLLPGDGQHRWAQSTDGGESWWHPSYEYACDDPNVHVCVRQMRGQYKYLVCAWSPLATEKSVGITVPGIGTFSVLARDCGALYYVDSPYSPVCSRILDAWHENPSRSASAAAIDWSQPDAFLNQTCSRIARRLDEAVDNGDLFGWSMVHGYTDYGITIDDGARSVTEYRATLDEAFGNAEARLEGIL